MGILRKVFGPSRDEIWRKLSETVDGRHVESTFFKAGRVEATHGEWTVTLDTHAVSNGKTRIIFTRVRAPYVNPDGFRFTIYRRGVFSDLGKLLGMQDVEIGDEEFDRAYIIKGTDEGRLRQLFADPRLRELIRRQPQMHLSVKNDEGWFGPKFPDNVDVLTFMVRGVIKDVDRLQALYDLFAETLDGLSRMGSAYETGTNVRL
jgi:hypothetical protein